MDCPPRDNVEGRTPCSRKDVGPVTASPRAGLSSRKLLSSIGIGAVVAAVAVVVGATTTPSTPTEALSVADESSTVAGSARATATARVAPVASTTDVAPESTFPSDAQGFVDTHARCDDSQFTIAFGRTERSIVAICTNPDGTYEYRGMRISDGATLTESVEAQGDGEFVARSDDVTYVVSAQEFYLMSGSEVVREEPWLEYHEPQLLPAESPAQPSSSSPETFAPVG